MRYRIIILMSLFILVLSSVSHAVTATYERHIAKGISYLETNDYRSAIDEFKAALKESPDDPLVVLYLGIALSRSGDKEAETTLKKALLLNPREPRTNLELGIYYFSKGVFDEAKDYFENTIEIAPNTEFSAKAEEYLKRVTERAAVKRWTLNISAGGQYDSNVILNPDDNPLPQGVSRRADWKAILYLRGKYNLITKEKLESSIGYSLYQNVHSNLSDFNITQHLLELRGAYGISPLLNLKGVYSFEYIFVGGERYDYAQSVSPSLIILEGRGFSTIVEYRYRNARFQDSPLFENNSDRTGSNHLIGITQNIPLQAYILAKVGYSHDEESTRQDYWNYRGNKGSAGLKVNLPRKILENALVELNGEYYNKSYEGINLSSGKERNDKAITGTISATKLLSQSYSITMSYLYSSNDSNIEAYNYKRAITSIFLNVRF